MPDAKTLIRLAQVLDGPARKPLIERLVTMAGEPSGARAGGCASIRRGGDTIHYLTDSTLLADGVRVVTRTLNRLRAPTR